MPLVHPPSPRLRRAGPLTSTRWRDPEFNPSPVLAVHAPGFAAGAVSRVTVPRNPRHQERAERAVRRHHFRRFERQNIGRGSEGKRRAVKPACQRGGEPHTGMRNLAGWVARLRPRSLKAVVPAASPPTRSAHFCGCGRRGQWDVGPSRSGTRVLVPAISRLKLRRGPVTGHHPELKVTSKKAHSYGRNSGNACQPEGAS